MRKSAHDLLVLMFSSMFLMFSCKHDPVLPPLGNENPPVTTTNCSPDTVYFQNDVLPIFQSSCAKSGCHDAASHEEGLNLSDYASIMSTGEINPGQPEDNDIWEAITSGSNEKVMPPPPYSRLTLNQLNLIYSWIQQGALNNACNNNECDSVNVTFSGQIWPMIQTSCYGCHSGNNPSGGISLTNYNDIKNNAARVWGSITYSPGYAPMPQGSSKLSDCKIAQFRRWMNLGTPNN